MTASREGWTLTSSRKGLEASRSLEAPTWENGQCNAGPSAEAKGTLELGDSEDVRVKALLVAQRRQKWEAPSGRVSVSFLLLLKPGQQ